MNMKGYVSKLLRKIFGEKGYSIFLGSVRESKAAMSLRSSRLMKFFLDAIRAVGVLERKIPQTAKYSSYSAQGNLVYPLLENQVRKIERGADNGVSIITLNLNGEKFLTQYCEGLNSLSNIPTQLIFVDHNSSDNSLRLLREYENKYGFEVIVIEKKTNDTYSKSNNEALRVAKYEHILLLNNDVVLTDQSVVEDAVDCLINNEQVGVVGWQLFYNKNLTSPQHEGISFLWDRDENFFRPMNIFGFRKADQIGALLMFPAVTAAMALVRKSDMIAISGMDESYNYGYEDVDLCLSIKQKLGKSSVVIDGLSAVHVESRTQKRNSRLSVRSRRLSNIAYFKSKFGYQIQRKNREALFEKGNPYNLKRLVIGFVVTEAGANTTAGDYFTALELSIAFEKNLNCTVEFFAMRGKGAVSEVDCSGVDLLIVMIDRFKLSSLVNRSGQTFVIAWIRNWFDRWPTWEYFDDYDMYLSSSIEGQRYLRDVHRVESSVFRLGSNVERFFQSCSNVREIEICFVGSRWNVPRDIERTFPVLGNFETQVFGEGWKEIEGYGVKFMDALEYSKVPSIYASSKIVIDDAASSTNKWSSVNSRIYDALAAGCMVITNGRGGVAELNDVSAGEIEIPYYSSNKELQLLIEKYLNDDELRISQCQKLQSQILENHSYSKRSDQFVADIGSRLQNSFRIAIKVPAPSGTKKQEWGDYHFAVSLRYALRKMGHQVRIDLLPDWYSSPSASDEVVIVLRGLSEYKANAHQINIMWNISHPDKVEDTEYASYDTVFIASQSYANSLAQKLTSTRIRALLQCTDHHRFFNDCADDIPKHEILFVGNSRKVYRDVVRYSVDADLPIAVYGGRWQGIISERLVKGNNITNSELRKYYSNANIVLNDHWQSMRENGFVSNRLFDAVACGSVVVTDYVAGLEEIFGGSVVSFDGTFDGFITAIEVARSTVVDSVDVKNVIDKHSFEVRAKVILSEIEFHSFSRMSGWYA